MPAVSEIQRLREIMARLRAPDGCPWDREQTHASLRPYMIEECCEFLEAVDRGDLEHMCEELGDVLLQVVFHAQLASEAGHFDFDDVARVISDKLVRRHPHVFGETTVSSSGEVLRQWDQIKAAEKAERAARRGESVPADEKAPLVKPMPGLLPALLRALDAYKQLVKRDALPRGGLVDAERIQALAAGLTPEEAGRRLFEIAAACRHAGIDPESALREHTQRVVEAAEAQRE
ncbi:MAG: MazG family protein [Verrucomicrobia bacterium]|nr:MAG: MazG family protein [Verrucomicrobiota bacterium]